MAATQPPPEIWRPIESLAPGVFEFFVRRVIAGVGNQPAALTSWWRSRAVNNRVGGDPGSQHLVALAVDLAVGDPRLLVDRLNGLGLFAIDEGDHVHAQLLRAGSAAPLISWLGV